MMSDVIKPIQDPETGRFVAGNGGNGGRPKGARAKLGELFIQALKDDFEANGVEAIIKVRDEKPDAYLKVIASLMPKDLNLNINPMEDATDAELVQRLRDLENVIRPFLAAEGSGKDSARTGPPTAH